MSYKTEGDAIEQYFTTAWGATTKIKYDNVKWEEPKADDSWVSLSLTNDAADVISVNPTALYRFPGVVIVQLFRKEGKGTGPLDALADQVMTLFRHKVLALPASEGYIHFKVPYKRRVGLANGWFQVNVVAPFSRDEVLVKPALP